MKTRTWILTILAIFTVSVGFATEFPTMNVIPVESDKAMLAYAAPSAATIEVTLSDCHGNVLYFKRTSGQVDELNQVFDFSEFKDGNYCMSVNYGNRSVSRSLIVKDEQISVGAPVRCYEPYFRLEDKILNVSFFNGKQKQVFVSIYKDGAYVDSYKLGKSLTIQKRLDLSRLDAGNYEVVITDSVKNHKFIAEL